MSKRAEQIVDGEALQSFIQAGPEGVRELAARQLGPELRALPGEIRRVETICVGEPA